MGDFYFFKNGLNKEKEFFGKGTPIVNFTDVFHNRGLFSYMLNGKVSLSDSEIERYKVKKGDLFFTRTSEVIEEIGMNSVMLDDVTDTVFSGFVLRGRAIDSEPLDNLFKKYVFSTSIFRNEMIKKSSMTTRALTSGTALKEMYFNYPIKKEEQKKIGLLLTTLENTITLQERKLSLLKLMKKGFLQQLFPKNEQVLPDIRFTNFQEVWEERKLKKIFKKIRNAFVGTATPHYVPKGNFYLESNNIKDGKINRNNEVFITDEFYLKQKDKWLKTNDIVMVQSGHVGHTAVIPPKLNNSAAHALIMFQEYIKKTDPNFINYQFLTATSKKKIKVLTTGNTIKHILASEMKLFKLSFPSFEEQIKIGNFFKQLDETITLQEKKIDQLKQIKKALLQKMFI